MKLSADRKKEILCDSYEALKLNAQKNDSSLAKVISQMAVIDLPLSFEMWKSLIKSNFGLFRSKDSFYISHGMLNEITHEVDEATAYQAVIDDITIRKYLYGESGGNIYGGTVIQYSIITNQLLIANELLDLAYRNKYKGRPFADILCDPIFHQGAIPRDQISDDAVQLLLSWIEKVEDREERARLNMEMLVHF